MFDANLMFVFNANKYCNKSNKRKNSYKSIFYTPINLSSFILTKRSLIHQTNNFIRIKFPRIANIIWNIYSTNKLAKFIITLIFHFIFYTTIVIFLYCHISEIACLASSIFIKIIFSSCSTWFLIKKVRWQILAIRCAWIYKCIT